MRTRRLFELDEWAAQASLKAGNAGESDDFGFSVGLLGNTLSLVVVARESSSMHC